MGTHGTIKVETKQQTVDLKRHILFYSLYTAFVITWTPDDAHMRQWSKSSPAETMAYSLIIN